MTDREIDALVAEKVMGFPVCRCLPEQRYAESGTHYDPETGMCLRCKNRACLNYTRFPAAWEQVLDKMAADGWSYQIVCYSNLSKVVNAGTFGCMFVNADESHKLEDSPTKGRAICLAALEAVKGKA